MAGADKPRMLVPEYMLGGPCSVCGPAYSKARQTIRRPSHCRDRSRVHLGLAALVSTVVVRTYLAYLHEVIASTAAQGAYRAHRDRLILQFQPAQTARIVVRR